MNIRFVLFGIILGFLAIQSVTMGCITDHGEKTPEIQSMGTVIFNESFGGYFEIVTDDGMRYYPVNPDVYPIHDGMYIYFEADPVENRSSGDPKGIPIRISLTGEYVSPMETAKITFSNPFSGQGP